MPAALICEWWIGEPRSISYGIPGTVSGIPVRSHTTRHDASAPCTHLWIGTRRAAGGSAFPDEAEAEADSVPRTEADSVAPEAELSPIPPATLVVAVAANGGAGAAGLRTDTAIASARQLLTSRDGVGYAVGDHGGRNRCLLLRPPTLEETRPARSRADRASLPSPHVDDHSCHRPAVAVCGVAVPATSRGRDQRASASGVP